MLTLSSALYASTNNEFVFYGSLFVRTIIVPTIYNCSEYIATVKKWQFVYLAFSVYMLC